MPRKRRAASSRAKPAPAAPPVDPGEAAVAAAVREAEEAAAALEAAHKASEEASRNLQTLRAYARAGLVGEGGVLLRPLAEQLSHDVWRSEIFPRLSALDTMNAAAVSRAWAEDVASGVKGRGEVVVFSHNLVPPERGLPLGSDETIAELEKELLAQQAKLLPTPSQQQQQLLLPWHFETPLRHISIRRAAKADSKIRAAKSVDAIADLIELCRANAGSLRRLRFRLTVDDVSRPELEAVSSLVSSMPLLSTIEISASTTRRFGDACKTPALLPCMLRAVADGVAASSLSSARGGGGGSVRALALRGKLLTELVTRDYRGNAVTRVSRELPRGWAEGLGLVPSAAGATTTTAATMATTAAAAAAASTPAWLRPYEETDDVALASSAFALLAKHSPIEKLALDIWFWQPWDRNEPPPQSAAEAAASRAAPRTLGALLQPLANHLIDLSVNSEHWRMATRGGFAREGASAPPAPSAAAAAAENSRPPPGLGPLPLLRVLRLVGPEPVTSAFLLSRASFEGIVRPSTLHFVKSTHSGTPFVVAAEDDDAAVVLLTEMPVRHPATTMASLARLPQAPLDAALAPLADCVTELLIDVAESDVAQSFHYSFGALRSLRRLAVRLARPSTSSKVLRDLNLSAFSRAHGRTLTSLDVSGFVNRRIKASPPFAALRRLVARGMRTPCSFNLPPPFRLPSQRGGYKELEFLAVEFVGHRSARLQFTDREWYARFCELQSRRSQGFLDLESLFAKKAPYPKLKLLLLENCDLVMTQVGSLAAFRSAGASAAAAAAAASSSSSPLPPSGGVAGPEELAARFLAGSSGMVRIHLHGCRFRGAAEGCFVPAAAEVLWPSGTGLTEDAARAAAFLRALASSVSSSSSPPDGGGGGGASGGGGSGKKRASQKKGGGGPTPRPPPPFKGFCFGCQCFGEWDDFVDEMKFCSD